MKPPHIHLNGTLDVPPDRLDAVRTALPEHIRLTCAEPGCLSFEVLPEASHPGRFTVAERFCSRDAFDAHQARVKASDWGRITAGLIRTYKITESPA